MTRGKLSQEILDYYPDAKLLDVEIKPAPQSSSREAIGEWRKELLAGNVDVVVYFPADFAAQLHRVRTESQTRSESNQESLIDVPRPMVLFNPSREASELAQGRVERILRRWKEQIAERILQDRDVPLNITQPFELDQVDVSGREIRQPAVYSKLLPFFVFLWALTGAFYPAVDLCAGEKERGTLEALLTSPAQRSEIVWGKLLTVMLFSVFTAILNLASMGFTAAFVARQIQAAAPDASEVFALPSLISILWIGLALLPIAALFSALSLACAAFARSTKEGQYYFMPLFMVTLPLMLAPMSPGTELTLGNSLIPITGLTFLLRALTVRPTRRCRNARLLLACNSLGHRAIQSRVRPLPRE
jgi:sodium transport system permease protein